MTSTDSMEESDSLYSPLIIIDGHCLLCSRAMRFILENEVSDEIKFTTIGSESCNSLNLASRIVEIPDSIMLYNESRLLVESRAVLEITKWLQRPYSYLHYLKYIPTFITDFFYRIIARNRYKWFGRSDRACELLPRHFKKRMLE